MPKAVLHEWSTGKGMYRQGDTAAHIWRIKPITGPDDMFSSNGSTVARDVDGPFLTLNFTCLGCHNGNEAPREDFDDVRQTWRLVH